MKLQSPMRYIPLALTVFLYLSSLVLAQQTTLVGYNFNDQNLNHYTLDGSVVQTPPTTLSFTDNGGIPTYQLNGNYRLQTDNTNDYLELRINTTGQSNMSIKFDGNLAPLGIGISLTGRWIVQSDSGSGGATWTQIGASANMTAYDLWIFGYQEGNSSSSIPIPTTSEGKTEVRFRIRPQGDGWFGNFAFRIDNVRIERGTPNITVTANGNSNTILNHDAPPSISNSTDFGNSVIVGENKPSGEFRIRNLVPIGTTNPPSLRIDDIQVIGPHAGDFTAVPTFSFPNNLAATNSISNSSSTFRRFSIHFSPQGDGIRVATVQIFTNGNQSPYSINVIGLGSSCSLYTTPYVVNEINPLISNPTLPSNINSSWIISGTASSNSLYLRNEDNRISLPSYNSPSGDNTSAWITRNTNSDNPNIVEFGGTDGINVSGLKDVSIAFNIGAYSTSTSRHTGPNTNDYIILEVEHNGSWSEAVRLRGYASQNSNDNRYLIGNPLSGNNYYVNTYTNGPRQEVQNSNTNKYQIIRLNIPQSKISNDPTLKFRIKAHTGANTRVWIIDNVRIDVSNVQTNELLSAGGGWTHGTPDNSNVSASRKIVVHSGRNFNIAGARVCECEVKAGGSLNIGTPNANPANTVPGYLQVQGKITVEEGGTLNVVNNSNLVQIEDDAVNSGNIKVNRYVTNIKNNLETGMDYIYWSSPVNGQQLKAFSPNTPNNRFYRYEESNDYFYPVNHLSNFEFGKGYAIRAEDGLSNPYNKTYHFTGVPQNGTQYDQENLKFIKSADGNGYNLIGNPYPSNIHADDFLTSNPGVFPTVFFWQNNVYIAHQQGSGYYGSNYAVYNSGSGGVPGTYDADSPIVTDGTIKSTQGFIVQVKPEGDGDEIIFRNSMRRTANTGTFYSKTEKDRFWLTLTNSHNLVNTMLIAYVPGASDAFERDFDVEMFSQGSDAIYSIVEGLKTSIQGLEHPVDIHDVIPMGVQHFEIGKYKIALHQKEGVFNGQKVYLKDKYLNTIHDLTQGAYEYEGAEGEVTDRFEIVFKKHSLTTASEAALTKNMIELKKQDQQIVINSSIEKIVDVEMFNLAGWSVYKRSDINLNEFKIPLNAFAKQIVVVRVQTESGEIVSQKFILN